MQTAAEANKASNNYKNIFKRNTNTKMCAPTKQATSAAAHSSHEMKSGSTTHDTSLDHHPTSIGKDGAVAGEQDPTNSSSVFNTTTMEATVLQSPRHVDNNIPTKHTNIHLTPYW